ncbi:MFS transporter [Paraburkholderia megapolitana]|uniref:MFS transporter n=1 Tax=Paraburkholderia megapolitana TaxID=420953 RepID=UPI000B81CFF2|nr:MFS transporter [Paraburkholderia megapolitana]QDQ82219.1 MFS transporter [Paraburkholderia megapolitana]
MPLIIIKHGGSLDLTIYETVLALSAIVAMPLLAARVEKMHRASALKLGCFGIFVSGIARVILLSNSYSLWLLTVIDVGGVCSFAAVQPLLGVYPAESVERDRVARAYRVRRVFSTIGRVAGPLVAAAALLYFVAPGVLLIAAFIGLVGLGYSMSLPRGGVIAVDRRRTVRQRIQEIVYGVRLKLALPPERFLTIVNFSLNVATVATVPMVIPTIIRANHLPDSSAGLFNAVFAGGAVTGVLLFGRLIANGVRQRQKFIGLWVALFVSLSSLTLMSNLVALTGALFAAGAFIATLSLVGVDRQTVSIPTGGRIRLTAAALMIGQLSSSVAFVVVGTFISRFGFDSMWMLYCGISVFVIAMSLKVKGIWHFLEDTKEAESYYERTHPRLVQRFFV